jgi:hypothetical protein
MQVAVCIRFFLQVKKKVNGKVRFRTGRECPQGELKYSSTLSLTSTLDGVGD